MTFLRTVSLGIALACGITVSAQADMSCKDNAREISQAPMTEFLGTWRANNGWRYQFFSEYHSGFMWGTLTPVDHTTAQLYEVSVCLGDDGKKFLRLHHARGCTVNCDETIEWNITQVDGHSVLDVGLSRTFTRVVD